MYYKRIIKEKRKVKREFFGVDYDKFANKILFLFNCRKNKKHDYEYDYSEKICLINKINYNTFS